MLDLVGNSEDRFSRDAAYLVPGAHVGYGVYLIPQTPRTERSNKITSTDFHLKLGLQQTLSKGLLYHRTCLFDLML